MRIAVFTSNAIRHKYVANMLTKEADEVLVVSECSQNDAVDMEKLKSSLSPIEAHFYERYQTEKKFFARNDSFISNVLPLLYKEINLPYVFEVVKKFQPDMMFCFGASIIKEPLISLLPPGRFINLHLGLSPYYRGSGTNFWPFVNEELEYVGATILHIDAGIDTGDIIAHVRPEIEIGDNVHTVGCKVIKAGASCLIEVMKMVRENKKLNRVKQWKVPDEKYYRGKDFNEKVLLRYKNNLANGLIERYLRGLKRKLRLVLPYRNK